MSVELRPLGVSCNIACQYCYQNPQRDAGNVPRSYDLSAMLETVTEINRPFAVFGGEPLMVPLEDLERMFAVGLESHGGATIQTNATLMRDQHIRLFRKYKVRVGISVDGPDELNDIRWAGTLEKTRTASAKTHAAIDKLAAADMPPALIVTLHRGNATAEKLPRMNDWLRELDQKGVPAVRLHILESDYAAIRKKYALSTEENIAVYLNFARLEKTLSQLRMDVFRDMKIMLQGEKGQASCVWRGCDPYTTAAVQGVEASGRMSNCGRTNKFGVDFVKADQTGFERYIALYNTPQEYQGCKGCRFFLMCKGNCPGTAENSDWRNRSEHCEIWKQLYQHLETEMVEAGEKPLSLAPERANAESLMLQYWRQGVNPPLSYALNQISQKPEPQLQN